MYRSTGTAAYCSLLKLPVKQRVNAHGLLRFHCIVQSGRFVLDLYAMALWGSQAYACRVYRHTWCTWTRAIAWLNSETESKAEESERPDTDDCIHTRCESQTRKLEACRIGDLSEPRQA